MIRATAIGLAAFLLACSNDTFVSGGDAGSDASDGGKPSDAAPPPDAIVPLDGAAEGGCGPSPSLPCSGPCGNAQACCVSSSSAACGASVTCLSGEVFNCTSSNDCSGGQICCLMNVSGFLACPAEVESSGDSLTTQCTSSCSGVRVCDVGANDCGGKGTCAMVQLDINPSFGLGLCR